MPAIIEYPTIVKDAVKEYGSVFANEPERKHFAEYLTGLMVAEKKNVAAINAEFAVTTDQSRLNRWINEVGYYWDHADKRHVIAHDYLIVDYVCTSGKHYALEFHRFRKRDACEAKRKELEARHGTSTSSCWRTACSCREMRLYPARANGLTAC